MAKIIQNINLLPKAIREQSHFIPINENKTPSIPGWQKDSNWGRYSEIDGFKGFVLKNTGIVVLDYDHIMDASGKMRPDVINKYMKTQTIVDKYGPTYKELSVSGTGMHLIVMVPEGELKPMAGGSNATIYLSDDPYDKEPKLEIWYDSMHQFFFTGDVPYGPQPEVVSGDRAVAMIGDILSLIERNDTNYTINSNSIDNKLSSDLDKAKIMDALSYINPDASYDAWIKVGMALKKEGFDASVFEEWSSSGAKYKPGEPTKKYDTFDINGSITGGTIIWIAKQNGYQPPHITSQAVGSNVSRIHLTSLATIVPMDAKWLIKDIIPEGDITMLVGDGGVGKGFIWANIAAAVSAGKNSLFDSAYGNKGCETPKKVVVFSSEDSLTIQIVKRLKWAKADLNNILSLDLSDPDFKNVKFDSDFLSQIVEQEHPALVVFDPVQSFFGDINIAARNEVRNSLNPLVSLGVRFGTSFLVVVHTNKKTGAAGRMRMADSADLWDIARSVLITGFTSDPGIRYISHEKSNYGIQQETILYSIVDGTITTFGTTEKKDRDYVTEALNSKVTKRGKPEQERAAEIIVNALSDGIKTIKEIDALCDAQQVSGATRQRAKKQLSAEGVIREWSSGYGPNKVGYIQRITHDSDDIERQEMLRY